MSTGRLVEVESRRIAGISNFRDLGGLRAGDATTRPGVLMRSAAPLEIGEDAQTQLARLGLRTIIDLREPIERTNDPVTPLGVDTHCVPVFEGTVDVQTPRGLPELYADIVASCGPRFAAVAEILARPGALPGLVFCSAGKDRTGIACGLILSAVGVDEAAVVADFAASSEAMTGAFRAELEARALLAGVTEQALAVSMGAPPELMAGLLASVRASHGGAGPYLVRHGLPAGALGELRRSLVG